MFRNPSQIGHLSHGAKILLVGAELSVTLPLT